MVYDCVHFLFPSPCATRLSCLLELLQTTKTGVALLHCITLYWQGATLLAARPYCTIGQRWERGTKTAGMSLIRYHCKVVKYYLFNYCYSLSFFQSPFLHLSICIYVYVYWTGVQFIYFIHLLFICPYICVSVQCTIIPLYYFCRKCQVRLATLTPPPAFSHTLLLLAFLSPFSLPPPPPLLSFHSTGTKRSLEWKKYIRYHSPCHLSIRISTSLSETKGPVTSSHDLRKWKASGPTPRPQCLLKLPQIWVISWSECSLERASHCRDGCIAYIVSLWHYGEFAFVPAASRLSWYFILVLLCPVLSFFTLCVSCDILSLCWKIWRNLSESWRLFAVVLMCFFFQCFLSFSPLCNVIGSDLFFCKSNYASKWGR